MTNEMLWLTSLVVILFGLYFMLALYAYRTRKKNYRKQEKRVMDYYLKWQNHIFDYVKNLDSKSLEKYKIFDKEIYIRDRYQIFRRSLVNVEVDHQIIEMIDESFSQRIHQEFNR